VLTALGAHAAGFATARRCLRFLVRNICRSQLKVPHMVRIPIRPAN